jgi:hypothetical protein
VHGWAKYVVLLTAYCCRIAAQVPGTDTGGFPLLAGKVRVCRYFDSVGAVGLEPTLPKDPDFKCGKVGSSTFIVVQDSV